MRCPRRSRKVSLRSPQIETRSSRPRTSTSSQSEGRLQAEITQLKKDLAATQTTERSASAPRKLTKDKLLSLQAKAGPSSGTGEQPQELGYMKTQRPPHTHRAAIERLGIDVPCLAEGEDDARCLQAFTELVRVLEAAPRSWTTWLMPRVARS